MPPPAPSAVFYAAGTPEPIVSEGLGSRPWIESTRWIDDIATRSATHWNASPGWVDAISGRPPNAWGAPVTPNESASGPGTSSEPAPLMVALAPLPPSEGFGPPGAASVHTDAAAAVSQRLSRVAEEIVAWFKTLCSAAVYATLIVTFGFQVARVEGQSMAPTLADQDRLIVNKFIYQISEPRRGDVVMLYYPINPKKSFVKRVIARETDQVRIVNGRVYVNDVPVSDEYVPPEYRSHDDYGQVVIPDGYYFVMGDHRNNSSDSRHWGYVPKKYIIGKVQLRWWPLPEARIF